MMPPATPVSPANNPGKTADASSDAVSRRGFFKRVFAYGVAPLVAGVYSTQIEPFWPKYHEVTIPIRNLPASFQGYRIAQLSDLHAGAAPMSYLRKVVERTAALKPDLVVVTGDLTHHNAAFAQPVSDLLSTFAVPVMVIFGNHEYGIRRADDHTEDMRLPDKVQAAILKNNHILLRNQSTTVDHADGKLWFVGLDDLWWGNFDPVKGYAGVPTDATVIALSHNPDTAMRLDTHKPALILSGHTHGGQVRLPFIGALYLNTYNRRLDQGLFQLKHSVIYVSRGIGYIYRIRFYCRPEVPVLKLVRA